MRKKRVDAPGERLSFSRDFCGSTTAGSLSTTANERPQSRRPTSRSIINCESLPKGSIARALESIAGQNEPRDILAEEDEDDSLLQELVDILDTRKPEDPLTHVSPILKVRSALQSPRQQEAISCFSLASRSPEPALTRASDILRLDLKRPLLIRKPKSIKLGTPKAHFPSLPPAAIKRREAKIIRD